MSEEGSAVPSVTAVLPFHLERSDDVVGSEGFRSTYETAHGLLRLTGDALEVQWRFERRVDQYGKEVRSDVSLEEVQSVRIPLEAVAGAHLRRRGLLWWRHPVCVLLGADLHAFEPVAGAMGLRTDHPSELALDIRREHGLAAEEFVAELALALAEGRRPLARPGTTRQLSGPPPEAP